MTGLQEYLCKIEDLEKKNTSLRNKLDMAIAAIIDKAQWCEKTCSCVLHKAIEQLLKK